ncbi:hypothetical protein BpHYR1_054667 [Brachionus plicatilis]|uniref:Uncharacterized protein n=1 Tax=Brachionus plicatilis TaxID=10195 RepID=A0A3M7QJ59_BRAPC|nr:hypothetical protein BpHYR1_054667 [Brachionus plicatilis]
MPRIIELFPRLLFELDNNPKITITITKPIRADCYTALFFDIDPIFFTLTIVFVMVKFKYLSVGFFIRGY